MSLVDMYESEGLVAVEALRRAGVAVRLAARLRHVGVHRRRAARVDADAPLLQARQEFNASSVAE